MTNTIRAPWRYDFVGSFLRPAYLKEAREQKAKGQISEEQLTETENKAIEDLIAKEKKAGFHILTDGEFRRSAWHLDFMWGFDGITHAPTKTGLPFAGEAAMIDDTWVTGKIAYKGHHPFLDHFRFVDERTDENTAAKLTIPAPAQFLEQFDMPFAKETTSRVYPDEKDLIHDIVEAYAAFIGDLYKEGCRNLQLDDCSWGLLADPRRYQFFDTDDAGIKEIKERYLDINNAVIARAPEDLTINTHVCRGNFHSTYAAAGGYDSIAAFLFARENVNAFYLEYDTERAGGFEPLRQVPKDKKVVLGLITTKSGELEDPDLIKRRIRQASAFIDLDRLCLSPQCGFASCEIGNKLSEQQEWDKLALVKKIAEDVWKDA